jgi:hypothetical protein
MKVILKPMLIGMAVGLACSIPLLCLVATSALGIYETPRIARVLFPYVASIDLSSSSTLLILGLLFLQYPFYGALLGIPWSQKKYRSFTLIVMLVLIVSCHVAAVRTANEADARWVESLSPE